MNEWYENQENISTKQDFNFATVVEVNRSMGVRLKFEESNESTTKYYKCADGINISTGDKVKVFKDSGTYIVEYKVGLPGAASEKIKFRINNTQYDSNQGINFTGWIATTDNIDGYSLMTYLTSKFLTLDGSTPVAYAGTTAIVNNKNYTMDPKHFQIAGVQQDIYEDDQRGTDWCAIPGLNTSGYSVAYKTVSGRGGYYFILNNVEVAYFASLNSGKIEIGHNYTL